MARTQSSGPRRDRALSGPAVEISNRQAPSSEFRDPQTPDVRRVDRLAEVVDHCTASKLVAEELGDRFLAYLLAMAIQEARTAMRVEIKMRATPKAKSAKAPRNG